MAGSTDLKWKGSALVGYGVNYMTFLFHLTKDLGNLYYITEAMLHCHKFINGLVQNRRTVKSLI